MATHFSSGYLAKLGTVLFGASVNGGLQRNILSGYVQSGLSILLIVISYPLYLGALGREQFSLWIIVASVINMNNVGTFGLSTALLRRTAECDARTDQDAIERMFAHSASLAVLFALAFAVLVYLTSDAVLAFLGINPGQMSLAKGWIVWMCLLIPLSYLVDQIQSLVAGLGRFDLANTSQVIQQTVVVAGALVGFSLGYQYHVLPVAMLVSFLLQSFALVVMARRVLPKFPRWFYPTDIKMHLSLLGMGSQVAASSMIELSFHIFNRLLVARYVGLLQVPVYEIAFNSSVRVRGALASGFKSLLPEAAKKASDGVEGHRKSSEIVRVLTIRLVVLSAIIWLISLLVGKWIFALWLGSEIGVPAHSAFLLICLGALVNTCTIPAFYTLLGMGKFRLMVEVSVVSSSVNLCIFFALVNLGITSPNPAVLSATGALFVSGVWTMWAAHRAGIMARIHPQREAEG